MAALALIKGCIDVAINTKKAVDFFKTMGKSEEEAFYFWRMLDALTAPLELAIALRRRHSTLHDVDAVVELARYTIARCELLVDRDGEGLPDDDSSGAWKEWLNGKKDGVSRLQIMRELLPKLQMTHQALTLALTSIRIKHDSDTLKIRSPFSFIPHATDVAVEVYHDFEFGRVESHIMIAMGEIYKSTQTPAAARGSKSAARLWCLLGTHAVNLHRRENEKTNASGYYLKFQQMKFASDLDSSKLDDSGVSEGEPTAHGDLSLSEDLSFARKWMDEIPELEVDESDKNRLVYKLGQEYLIAFESTANISAETFEAIICIGKCLQPSSSRKPTCIADLSLDDRRWWKAQLEKQLGPFYEQESHEDVNSIISPIREQLRKTTLND